MPQKLKFTADMATFKKAINFVRNGLGASKTDLPVTLIRCNLTGNKLTMFAFSKEMFCRNEIRVTREEDESDGSFALLGQKIINLVNTTETEKIAFEVDDENLQATAGFLTVNFELFDGASVKQAEATVSEHLTKDGELLDRSALEEALVCAKICATINSIRPDVNHAELRNGKMLSSDGRKIMIYKHSGFGDKIKLKVPAGTLSQMASALKNIEAENVQILEGLTYYYIKTGLNENSLGIRKVERDFPQIESQIAQTEPPSDEVSIDKNVLTNMISGVALGLSSDEVKVQVDVDGTSKMEAYLEVSSKNSLGRRSYERASCGRTGKSPVSFPVSFKHLLDTLSVFKGDSVVDLAIYSRLNLLMVRDSTALREVITVIPFRTDAAVEQEKKEAAEAEAARKKAAEEASVTDSKEEGLAAAAAAAPVEEDVDIGA